MPSVPVAFSRRVIALAFALASVSALLTLPALVSAAPLAPMPDEVAPSSTPDEIAPSPMPTASASALPEIVHVVTSDRHDEPISQSSRPTFVVDRAEIEAHGARSVADALVNVPGVTQLRYGGFGAQALTGVRIGGSSISSSTLILLDGIPISPASSGAIDLGGLSTTGVDRIEVVESGASTLYGTSAVGGVVNIITSVPRGTYLALSDGSLGDRDGRVAYGDGDGHFGIAAERHVASNVYDYPAIDGFPAGTRANADAEQSVMRAVYRDDIGRFWHLRASVGEDAIAIGVPGGLSFLTPNARQHTSFDDASLAVTRAGAQSSLSLTLAGSRQALVYADPDNGGESDTYDGRGQLSLRDVVTSTRDTVVAGMDVSRESALLSLGPSGPPPNLTASLAQSAAYGQLTHAFGTRWTVTGGLRGENDAPFGSILAPSLGTSVRVGDVKLAGNVGEAFRVPTIVDLYYPGFSNPNLQPEKSLDTDLTVATDHLLGGASLGWFSRAANDLIVLDSNFVPQNRQHAHIDGLMATIRTKPMHGVVTSLSITDLYRAQDTSAGADNARLPFSPTLQSILTLERPIGASPWGFGIDARIIGPHVESATPAATGGYTAVDAFVRVRAARTGVVSLRVNDLGDERYAPIVGYPVPGRTFTLEYATR